METCNAQKYEGLEILESEVRSALAKRTRNKVAGSEGIAIEISAAMEDFCIDKIVQIINEIYNSDDIQENHSRSIFIALAKKQMQMNEFNQPNELHNKTSSKF